MGIDDDIKIFSDMFGNSYESYLKEAYSSMDVKNQSWAKHTIEEIDYITTHFNNVKSVLDVGCGTGRHAIELGKRGYQVTGVDASEKLIDIAITNVQNTEDDICKSTCHFLTCDMRNEHLNRMFDAALCLYDVVGSYPADADNRSIIDNIYMHLNPNGILVMSVMNMELTEVLVPDKNKIDVNKHPEAIKNLLPGNIMQTTGEVFDSDHIIIDSETGIVYRKEQFGSDQLIHGEYIIRDKRFRMEEIKNMAESSGFEVIHKAYVRAGCFDENLSATDRHAKEILLICRK